MRLKPQKIDRPKTEVCHLTLNKTRTPGTRYLVPHSRLHATVKTNFRRNYLLIYFQKFIFQPLPLHEFDTDCACQLLKKESSYMVSCNQSVTRIKAGCSLCCNLMKPTHQRQNSTITSLIVFVRITLLMMDDVLPRDDREERACAGPWRL